MQERIAKTPADHDQLMERLADLCRLDQEAVGAFDNISAAIGDTNWALGKLVRQMRNEHAEHVIAIGSMMAKMGGEPPGRLPLVPGFLIGGLFSLRETEGRAAALAAIRTNKMLTSAHYESALYWDAPDELQSLLTRFATNERVLRDYLSINPDLFV